MTNQKIIDAIGILKSVGMPKQQLNDRSALCLLALLNVKPENTWKSSSNIPRGITPIMDFVKDHYDKIYAPNSRETFRRHTMHQFLAAGMVLYNPDDPARPVNSPNAVYQVSPDFLNLVRKYDTDDWAAELQLYLDGHQLLTEKYARERESHKIRTEIRPGFEVMLSSGKHSQLIKDIIEEFRPRFIRDGEVIYVGDTANKNLHNEKDTLKSLGLVIDDHGKMPDVILYQKQKKWLVLIESVTSHGPIDAKRYDELTNIFTNTESDLVFITAFPDRKTLNKYLPAIAWETEVWIADNPTHLIHFNGDKFLGPHK